MTVKIHWDVRKLSGRFRLTSVADYGNAIRELFEDNNLGTLNVTVRKNVVTNDSFAETG